MARYIFCTLVLAGFAVEAFGQTLRDTTNHADYIVIAPATYFPVAKELAAFRGANSGFSTMVIDIDSILVQFGQSTSPDTALKNFIQYSLDRWQGRPQFFVLAGNVNSIPSHLVKETLYEQGNQDTLIARDQWYVQPLTTDGAIHFNACLGRFPAWDSAGFATMVDKTIQYENDSMHPWYNKAIAVADYWWADGNIFEYDSKTLQLHMDSLWTDTVTVHIRTDSPNYIDSTGFLSLWNEGAALIAYTGHANDYQLSHYRYFTTWSVDSLTNSNGLPVCIFGGCDLNFNTEPIHSISTHLLEHEGGGAVAVIASSGLMYEYSAQMFYQSLYSALIKNPDVPLGKVYEQAMLGGSWGVTDRFTFLGDPALTVKHSARSTEVATPNIVPTSYTLEQNFPNPFNPTTVIRYAIPANTRVTLKVYDILGRELQTLVDEHQNIGSHSVVFHAGHLSSGVYLYQLRAGSFVETKKLVLVK